MLSSLFAAIASAVFERLTAIISLEFYRVYTHVYSRTSRDNLPVKFNSRGGSALFGLSSPKGSSETQGAANGFLTKLRIFVLFLFVF